MSRSHLKNWNGLWKLRPVAEKACQTKNTHGVWSNVNNALDFSMEPPAAIVAA
ncbi:hypothetical protein J23TS9_43930 [Paenibacillus sp. J23TS9]|nr:hypothetical protein J23TS9_43930 [Paenibacillus sp. J23TS9]